MHVTSRQKIPLPHIVPEDKDSAYALAVALGRPIKKTTPRPHNALRKLTCTVPQCRHGLLACYDCTVGLPDGAVPSNLGPLNWWPSFFLRLQSLKGVEGENFPVHS